MKDIISSLTRCLVRLRCLVRGHRVYLYASSGEPALSTDEDGMTCAYCADCKTKLKAICGLSLPGFRLGTAPKPSKKF